MPAALEELLGEIDCDAIGVQCEHMRVSTRRDLAKRIGEKRLRDTEGVLSGLRVVKDELEVRAIRKAIKIQQEAFEAVLGGVQTFLLWLDFRALGLPPNALNGFLRNQAKWAVTRGPAFGQEGIGFVRLNIACTRTRLDAALNRLALALSALPDPADMP